MAFMRSNLGNSAIHWQEVVASVDELQPVLGRDWHDEPMTSVGNGVWECRIPLISIGVFSVKCFYQYGKEIVWAEGDNFFLKVEPPLTAGVNLIYAAFVRQFGANKYRTRREEENEAQIKNLDDKGYTVIPRSGTFRDVIRELDFIFNKLGSEILLLLPIHPLPVSFGRMGRFGSPFAATDYFNVEPSLAEFDPAATPLEQFGELVDAVHSYRCRIFLDIPVNHTGWSSKLQTEHPELFVRDANGRFVSPGAWGVVWEDLCKLDYSDTATWKLMADVFRYWCRKGVDGFRCDAGYMLPKAAWDYIVAKVRSEFPFTVFLLEGLGGPPVTQERLLGECGLNWAYSELFQNYSRSAIEYYYSVLATGSKANGLLVNFAETHDNSRLAAVSATWSRLRCAVTAALCDNGGFGITNGVEFLATERIDVHKDSALNWNNPVNIVSFISRLQRILRENCCFYAGAEWSFIHNGDSETLAVARRSRDGQKCLLILLNLEAENTNIVSWRNSPCNGQVIDLLTGKNLDVTTNGTYSLAPGEALFLTADQADYNVLQTPISRTDGIVIQQSCRYMALRLYAHLRPVKFPQLHFAPEELAQEMFHYFPDYLARVSGRDVGNCVYYYVNEAIKRQVMVFSNGILALINSEKFQVSVVYSTGNANEVRTVEHCDSFPMADGREGTLLFMPEYNSDSVLPLEISLIIYQSNGIAHKKGHLLLTPGNQAVRVAMHYKRNELLKYDRYALLINCLSGYSQTASAWGTLRSKYDALLAANCNSDVPVDRYVMFTRCRAWVVFRGFSFSLDSRCWAAWQLSCGNSTYWDFEVPVGQGLMVNIRMYLTMALNGNAIRLRFERLAAQNSSHSLLDAQPVKIILRPDLEDRVNHTVTKAFTGPEHLYPVSVHPVEGGFDFQPSERCLSIRMPEAKCVIQPEWSYMVELPREKYYGLEDHTDLFSPGYLEFSLCGGAWAELDAFVSYNNVKTEPENLTWTEQKMRYPESVALPELLRRALEIYVVKRDNLSTVIAGYPWFLDWGRDTLICLRGLMAGGKMKEASAIIRKFAAFEQQGTIPNMIRGNDVSNRDTSDAPLWLIVATRDYVELSGEKAILERRCGKRKLIEILKSIVEYYMSGTTNGIVMDKESCLIFSPRHFTWMDTNYPAATPREGYPIEIQALWFAALTFLAEHFPEYYAIAEQVRNSIVKYYYLGRLQGFSDCLHCGKNVAAKEAAADNAVRPNQLLAITLGVIKEREQKLSILHVCAQLLIPGAIRSLADRRVEPPLPVYWHSNLLNNPDYPYQGRYAGAEDTSRKVAYHNGTAWCWPFPLYVEALLMTGGESVIEQARGYLNSAQLLMQEAVPWQLPEVADGDYPHRWGGCGAQAWSVTEFYRVWRKLESMLR